MITHHILSLLHFRIIFNYHQGNAVYHIQSIIQIHGTKTDSSKLIKQDIEAKNIKIL